MVQRKHSHSKMGEYKNNKESLDQQDQYQEGQTLNPRAPSLTSGECGVMM
jgi:hypothetical protein